MTTRLAELLEADVAGRLGVVARRRVVSAFGLEAMVARYERLYTG